MVYNIAAKFLPKKYGDRYTRSSAFGPDTQSAFRKPADFTWARIQTRGGSIT